MVPVTIPQRPAFRLCWSSDLPESLPQGGAAPERLQTSVEAEPRVAPLWTDSGDVGASCCDQCWTRPSCYSAGPRGLGAWPPFRPRMAPGGLGTVAPRRGPPVAVVAAAECRTLPMWAEAGQVSVRGSRIFCAAAPPAPSWTAGRAGASVRARRSECRQAATSSSGSVHRARDGRWALAQWAWEPKSDLAELRGQTDTPAWPSAEAVDYGVLGSSRIVLGTTVTFVLWNLVGTGAGRSKLTSGKRQLFPDGIDVRLTDRVVENL
jgi:hypothetical protein